MNTRDLLKSETKAAHQSLDALVGQLDSFSSSGRYRIYLSAMHQLYCIYGTAIDWSSNAAGLTPSVANLKSAIESDLNRKLNAPVQLASSGGLEEPQSQSEKWAVGYVMEGSAMGARYMKNLAQSLAETSDEPLGSTYFETLAQNSYERWPTFVKQLNLAQCDADEAVDAANSVFETATLIFKGRMKALAIHQDK